MSHGSFYYCPSEWQASNQYEKFCFGVFNFSLFLTIIGQNIQLSLKADYSIYSWMM